MQTLSEALADYIENNTDLVLGDSLMFGEMIVGNQGVYMIDEQSAPPDIYQKSLEWNRPIAFWSLNANAKEGWNQLNEIYELFHTIENEQVGDWYIFLSRAMTQIVDMDRDIEGYKMWRFNIDVTCAYNEQES